MPLGKYIRFIERKTNGLRFEVREQRLGARLSTYGRVVPRSGRLELEIADKRLETWTKRSSLSCPVLKIDPVRYVLPCGIVKLSPKGELSHGVEANSKDSFPVRGFSSTSLAQQYPADGNVVLKLINTRNELSRHVVAGLLDYQREFWNTGTESDIKALTLKQFISLFPHRLLDQSRLSRLVSHLSLQTREGNIVRLRKLFISKRRFFANLIKEIVDQSAVSLTDPDIRTILREKHGISLSSRSICNCRMLLEIPNFRKRTGCYYPKNVSFSSYIALSPKQARRIPAEAGVYELSIPSKIAYPKGASNVIYIGTSDMLRRRIASYCNGRSKNSRLAEFFGGDKVYVRYHVGTGHLEMEKTLLRSFKKHFGKLPKGNLIGGHYGQPA